MDFEIVSISTQLGSSDAMKKGVLHYGATTLSFGRVPVESYGKSEEIRMTYKLAGKTRSRTFRLARRTEEEMKQYFGKGGKPPYPFMINLLQATGR